MKHWEGHLELETSLTQLAIFNLYNCTTDKQRFPLPFVNLLLKPVCHRGPLGLEFA